MNFKFRLPATTAWECTLERPYKARHALARLNSIGKVARNERNGMGDFKKQRNSSYEKACSLGTFSEDIHRIFEPVF